MSAPTAPKKRAKKAVSKQKAEDSVPDVLADVLPDRAGGIAPDGSFTKRVIGAEGAKPNPMIEVFELDGITYSVPETPNLAALIQFQEDIRRYGGARAAQSLAMTLLGSETVRKLAEDRRTTSTDLGHIFAGVMKIGLEGVDKMSETIRRHTDPTSRGRSS